MNSPKPLACVRCGAPIPSGFECAACASPRPPQGANVFDDEPPAEAPRSDGPKLALASLLALAMVGVLVYGGIGGSAAMARDKAEATRKEAAREARWAERQARERAQATAQTAVPAAPSAAPPRFDQQKFDADLARITAEADAGLNPPPPTVPTAAPSTPAATAICQICHGTGTRTEECGECNGEGEVECATCTALARYSPKSGWGNFSEQHSRCRACGGSSTPVRDVSGHDRYVYTCPKCHGAKEVSKRCFNCYGTGRISPAP